MSKKKLSDFAILGGAPTFQKPVPLGQLYFPNWERYEATFRAIFERQYYTNHGPLAQEFESKLSSLLGVKHVICVTNATIGLTMAADALNLNGKVIVPAFSFIATPQSVSWAGLEPLFCDVDPVTHHMSTEHIEQLIDNSVSAILGVNLWGNSCGPDALVALAQKHDLKLYFDSSHAFSCQMRTASIGNFGNMEVFSFHATQILSSMEGGCICTSDDALAAKLRNIRSSYGAGSSVEVVRTSNGRMSEAQAAIGLLNLEDLPRNSNRNKQMFDLYCTYLADVPGVKVYLHEAVSVSNYQSLICEIDAANFGMSRNDLINILRAENVIAGRCFDPGAHRSLPYKETYFKVGRAMPNTDASSAKLIQLPLGARVSDDNIYEICRLILAIHRHGGSLLSNEGE